jgi:hypothetical protein
MQPENILGHLTRSPGGAGVHVRVRGHNAEPKARDLRSKRKPLDQIMR